MDWDAGFVRNERHQQAWRYVQIKSFIINNPRLALLYVLFMPFLLQHKDKRHEQSMDVSYEPKDSEIYCELSPLIPESVEHINSCFENKAPIRPTKLDLDAPKRPARHLRPPSIAGDSTSPQRSPGITEFIDRKLLVTFCTKKKR